MSKGLPGKFVENDGVSAVIVAVMIFVLVGLLPWRLISASCCMRNELQNAADAVRLTGASTLSRDGAVN
jgi:hypothetical protein